MCRRSRRTTSSKTALASLGDCCAASRAPASARLSARGSASSSSSEAGAGAASSHVTPSGCSTPLLLATPSIGCDTIIGCTPLLGTPSHPAGCGMATRGVVVDGSWAVAGRASTRGGGAGAERERQCTMLLMPSAHVARRARGRVAPPSVFSRAAARGAGTAAANAGNACRDHTDGLQRGTPSVGRNLGIQWRRH